MVQYITPQWAQSSDTDTCWVMVLKQLSQHSLYYMYCGNNCELEAFYAIILQMSQDEGSVLKTLIYT